MAERLSDNEIPLAAVDWGSDGIGTRITKALREHSPELKSVGDLRGQTRSELLRTPNLGAMAVQRILAVLSDEGGVALKPEIGEVLLDALRIHGKTYAQDRLAGLAAAHDPVGPKIIDQLIRIAGALERISARLDSWNTERSLRIINR